VIRGRRTLHGNGNKARFLSEAELDEWFETLERIARERRPIYRGQVASAARQEATASSASSASP
jgi:hypothetical protein